MSRTPARIRQADVARAIRAAQQCGAGPVRILTDGTITIEPKAVVEKRADLVDDDEEIVL